MKLRWKRNETKIKTKIGNRRKKIEKLEVRYRKMKQNKKEEEKDEGKRIKKSYANLFIYLNMLHIVPVVVKIMCKTRKFDVPLFNNNTEVEKFHLRFNYTYIHRASLPGLILI